jgi:hypothetical protein
MVFENRLLRKIFRPKSGKMVKQSHSTPMEAQAGEDI